MNVTKVVLLAVTALAMVLASATPAMALSTLADANSVVQVGVEHGVVSWEVNGVEQLARQSFWFRLDETGPEREIGSANLAVDVAGTTDVNFNGDDDAFFVRYLGEGLSVEILYTLQGGAPGSVSSDLATQFKVCNTTNRTVELHLFQYVNFDLAGVAGDDTLRMLNANTAKQSCLTVANETVVTPSPHHVWLGDATELLGALDDGYTTELLTEPADAGVFVGDAAWMYQWDIVLGPVGSGAECFQLSNDKGNGAVPEPATMLSLGMVVAGLSSYLRKRRTA